MDEEHDERKAKELVRARELTVRPLLGHRLMARLDRRRARRPVGSTARLFAKMGWKDPFALPGEEVDPHRPVYVSGRFVRLDKAVEARKAADPWAKIRRMQERQTRAREEALRRAATQALRRRSSRGRV